MSSTKILVIGANGQIGSELIEALAARYGNQSVLARKGVLPIFIMKPWTHWMPPSWAHWSKRMGSIKFICLRRRFLPRVKKTRCGPGTLIHVHYSMCWN